MTDEQILTKAIEKAVANKWSNDYDWQIFNGELANFDHDHVWPGQLLFDHSFAKALWGDGKSREYNGWNLETGKPLTDAEKKKYIPKSPPVWQNYLQQMVVADDPIKYLGENI